eukprot:3275880-Amphidinium_carterae.1
MYRAEVDGGWCRYFMFYHHRSNTDPSTCELWVPKTTQLGDPEVGHEKCDESNLEYEGSTTNGPKYASYELVRPVPHSPQPSGIYPGGRGVFYRVWNQCPADSNQPAGCGSWRHPYAALYASFNGEYAAQTPMFEGVRLDYLRGPFGDEVTSISNNAEHIVPHNKEEAGYSSLREAAGSHGIITEVMGFFVAPFTANYSFMVWANGNHYEDMWMSTSTDPSDVVQVAETVSSHCRNVWGRRRDVGRTLCSAFGMPGITDTSIASQHRGKLLKDMP